MRVLSNRSLPGQQKATAFGREWMGPLLTGMSPHRSVDYEPWPLPAELHLRIKQAS